MFVLFVCISEQRRVLMTWTSTGRTCDSRQLVVAKSEIIEICSVVVKCTEIRARAVPLS